MFLCVLMCLDVFGREIKEKREREFAQKLPRNHSKTAQKRSYLISGLEKDVLATL